MPKRDWKKINEALVRRGELLLDLDFVKGWESENGPAGRALTEDR